MAGQFHENRVLPGCSSRAFYRADDRTRVRRGLRWSSCLATVCPGVSASVSHTVMRNSGFQPITGELRQEGTESPHVSERDQQILADQQFVLSLPLQSTTPSQGRELPMVAKLG